MSSVVLRRAEVADRAAIAGLVTDAFTVHIPRVGRPPGPMTTDFDTVLTTSRTWVIEADGDVVAVIITEVRGDHLYIDTVAVAPSQQGKGYARRLLVLAEHDAADLGLPEIRLCTNEAMTENIEFYRRLGYAETGRGLEDGYQRVFFSKVVSTAQ